MQSQKSKFNVTDKKQAIALAFNPANSESKKYIAIEKSLPKIKGLKQPMERTEFAFDLLRQMVKNGIYIEFRERECRN